MDKYRNFIDKLYQLRQSSFQQEGEYGIGNLVFKEFRNKGYLDNLKDLSKKEISKDLTLEQLKEDYEDNPFELKEFSNMTGIYGIRGFFSVVTGIEGLSENFKIFITGTDIESIHDIRKYCNIDLIKNMEKSKLIKFIEEVNTQVKEIFKPKIIYKNNKFFDIDKLDIEVPSEEFDEFLKVLSNLLYEIYKGIK